MKYSLSYGGWAGLTAEGGSLGRIEIRHDGRLFTVPTESLIKLKYVKAKPDSKCKSRFIKPGQKYYVAATRCKQFVAVFFKHPTGIKGVRFIQCPNKENLQQVKKALVEEYCMLKNISDDAWPVKVALSEETEEVVFKDLEEEV